MSNSDHPSQEIPRIEAAKLQLDAAIKLWLDEGDPLAVHTLAMASYKLLKDLMAPLDPQIHRASDERIREVIGYSNFSRIANALKHADRDSELPVDLPPDLMNESLLGSSLVFYRVITNDLSPIMGAFHLMSLSAHSEKFKVAPDDDPDIEEAAQIAGKMLRENVTLRREEVRRNLKLIKLGVFPANISLRRTHHTPDR